MRSPIETLFSESDREAIRAATREAERETSGELVVYVVERCDPHPEIAWKGASLGGAVGSVLSVLAVHQVDRWGTPEYLWVLIGLQVGLLVGWLLSRIPAIGRRLVAREALAHRTESRAAEAFVEEAVFATRDRTGVLLFIALFEHLVLILADEGIEQRVERGAWDAVTKTLATGIREGQPAMAVIQAVEQCAALLREHGFVSEDSENQISNAPRFRRE